MDQVVQERRKREHVATHIDRETRERLFELAVAEDRSVSAILRRALVRELDRADEKEGQA